MKNTCSNNCLNICINNSLNTYFSLKPVSSPDWTLIYEGVNNSIPLKTDLIVSNGVGDEVQTIVIRICWFLTTFGCFNINREHHGCVSGTNITGGRRRVTKVRKKQSKMMIDDLCLCFYLYYFYLFYFIYLFIFLPCLIVRIVGCYVIFIFSLLFLIVWCNL